MHALNTFTNAMSIDVEDYFQVGAFANTIDPKKWDDYECRVERNIDLILNELDNAKVHATFFTLGWIAKRYPDVIKKIAKSGHELASHGYGHQRVTDLSPEQFRADVIESKLILEELSGASVIGYRAPSFSIGRTNLWAHDVLAETGHLYSSSVYPVAHDHYGMPEAPRFKYRTASGLIEIPPTSVRLAGKNLPASGGGYFRLLPFWLSAASIRQVHKSDASPTIFYCHPWEFDPEQPRIQNAKLLSKFRHYVNLKSNTGKFRRLLKDFSWDRIDRVFDISTATIKA
jgi:polysaccharide deacetylase family protein (PEP-CTERM system associated)